MSPKNSNNITLGAGTFYIDGEKIGEVSEAKFTSEPDDIESIYPSIARLGSACEEFSASIKMATEAYIRFVHVVTGIEKHLFELCTNRRVVHLARHARKLRTRKKNYKRMIRICEKKEKRKHLYQY